MIRENTEGPYVGEGGVLRKGTPHEVATQGSVNTRMGVERCVRYAFELAAGRPRKHLTLVHKTNVLTFAGNLWERTFHEVAAEYPAVATAYNHVDAACIYFVQDPQRYDVIVTDNLFGDILTDLGGAVSGGIGLASSANLNPARTGPSMFEPVHGSAPDIVGTGKANPTAAILSAALMLDFLGEGDAAGAHPVRPAPSRSPAPPPRSATPSPPGWPERAAAQIYSSAPKPVPEKSASVSTRPTGVHLDRPGAGTPPSTIGRSATLFVVVAPRRWCPPGWP